MLRGCVAHTRRISTMQTYVDSGSVATLSTKTFWGPASQLCLTTVVTRFFPRLPSAHPTRQIRQKSEPPLDNALQTRSRGHTGARLLSRYLARSNHQRRGGACESATTSTGRCVDMREGPPPLRKNAAQLAQTGKAWTLPPGAVWLVREGSSQKKQPRQRKHARESVAGVTSPA